MTTARAFFTDRGREARAEKLGEEVARYLTHRLGPSKTLPLVPQERVDELVGLGGASTKPAEAARFVGASLIAGGSVTGVGTDFVIELVLVDGTTGEAVAAALGFAAVRQNDVAGYDVAGPLYLREGCAPGAEEKCVRAIEGIRTQQTVALAAAGALALSGVALWIWGFVDAAIYGEDYSDVVYGEQ